MRMTKGQVVGRAHRQRFPKRSDQPGKWIVFNASRGSNQETKAKAATVEVRVGNIAPSPRRMSKPKRGSMDAETVKPVLQEPENKSFGPRTIFELRSDTCRYPLWGDADYPDAETSKYCGAWTGGGDVVYCKKHRLRIVDPNRKRQSLRIR